MFRSWGVDPLRELSFLSCPLTGFDETVTDGDMMGVLLLLLFTRSIFCLVADKPVDLDLGSMCMMLGLWLRLVAFWIGLRF